MTERSSIFKEPVFHFLLAGAALFALSAAVGGDSEPERETVIDAAAVQAEIDQYVDRHGVEPTPEELEGMVAQLVRTEALFRGAIERELYESAPGAKSNLARAMATELYALSVAEDPTREELEAWVAENTERYSQPARVVFGHLFFAKTEDDSARKAAERAVAHLRATNYQSATLPDWGDKYPGLDPTLGLEHDALREEFGDAIADAVLEGELKAWLGPLVGPKGFHVIRVGIRVAARGPKIDGEEDRFRMDYVSEKRNEAVDAFVEEAKARFGIRVEMPAPGGGGSATTEEGSP